MSTPESTSETPAAAESSARSGQTPSASYLLAVFALAVVWFGLFAWRGSLLSSDEIIYAMMARSMVEGGNWLDLTVEGMVFHQRPPLAIWLMALSGKIFGFGELGLRLPGVLAAGAATSAVAAIGTQLWGRRAGTSAAILLAASTLFFYNARRPMTDLPMIALSTWALALYVLGGERKRWWAIGALAGAAAMVKHVVAVLPAVVVVVDQLLRGRRSVDARVEWRGLAQALAAFLGVFAPWHVAQSLRHGDGFWREYVGLHVVQRASESWFFESDPLFYLKSLVRHDGLLALVFLGGVIGVLILRARRSPGTRGDLLVIGWAAAVFLPFQLSSTRLDHYLLPTIPPLALLGARVLVAAIPPRHARWSPAIALLLAALAIPGTLPHLIAPDYSPEEKRFAEIVRGADTRVRLTSLDHYGQALFWYAEKPLDFSTTTERAVGFLRQSEVLDRLGAIELFPIADPPQSIAPGPSDVVAPPGAVGPLERVAASRGASVEVIAGTYVSLIRIRPPSP